MSGGFGVHWQKYTSLAYTRGRFRVLWPNTPFFRADWPMLPYTRREYLCIHTLLCVYTRNGPMCTSCVHTSTRVVYMCIYTSTRVVYMSVHTSTRVVYMCIYTSTRVVYMSVHTSTRVVYMSVHTSTRVVYMSVHTSTSCVYTPDRHRVYAILRKRASGLHTARRLAEM